MTPPPPRRITDVYPAYSQELLKVILKDYQEAVVDYLNRTERGHYRFPKMFDFEPGGWSIQQDDIVISCSLFFKPASFAKRNCHPEVNGDGQIPLEQLHQVPHPTFAGTRREHRSFFETFVKCLTEAQWQGCKCVVFLAADLRCLKPVLEKNSIRVAMMRHTSVAMCPGAMWRFMAFNLPCRAVYVQDTDRPFAFQRMEALLTLLEDHPNAALVRPLQRTGSGGEMPLILGNNFMVRPAFVDFDSPKSMLGYIALNILTEDRLTPFTHETWQGRRPRASRLLQPDYSGPMPSERLPAKCFPYYGFDERWLKEVVYPHFSHRGRILTMVQHHDPADLYQNLDLCYQDEHRNAIVWPGDSDPHGAVSRLHRTP